MRVLGIDPGSHTTGYGVVEKKGPDLLPVDNGCLMTNRKSSFPERLLQIYESLIERIEFFHPDAIAIEEVFYAKNVHSMLKLGESRGVALLAAIQNGVPIFEYSTRAVKQAITGYGNATKDQIQQMVQRLLSLPQPAQEDASDALALAICHLNSFKVLSAGKGKTAAS